MFLQAIVHPFLFPWLSPLLQISLNGSIWATVSLAIERFISNVHPRFWSVLALLFSVLKFGYFTNDLGD